PLLVAGQQHGGIAQGAAQALYEWVQYDEDGNPLTSTLVDYASPAASELCSFEVSNTQTDSPRNPLGAKGIGESGTIGSTPAIQNAVVDAVSHLGVTHIDMPAPPNAYGAPSKPPAEAPSRVRPRLDDRVHGEGTVDVGEAVLDADLGADLRRVDRQQDHVLDVAVVPLRRALHLLGEGAVDEALLLERAVDRRPPVLARGDGGVPVGSHGEVEDRPGLVHLLSLPEPSLRCPAMQGSVTVHMNASPEQVWDLVSDVTKIGRYSPETFEAKWIDGATGPAVGAKFQGHVKRNGWGPTYWTTCTVTACEPGRQFAFGVGNSSTPLNTWSYRIEPAGDG